jgi:hypothetical protein
VANLNVFWDLPVDLYKQCAQITTGGPVLLPLLPPV